MKLNFYDIENKYTDYLRKYENKIPFINYNNRDKFLCGTVLSINNINYYVPVSSNKSKYMSSFMIYDYDKNGNKYPISSLRFSFMFPCPIECITQKNINNQVDIKYRGLMQKEYQYCNKNISQIINKAKKIYNLAQNENYREKYNLCDFKLLEQKCIEYIIIQNVLDTLKFIHKEEDLFYIYDKLENKDVFEKCIKLMDNPELSDKIQELDIGKFEEIVEKSN